MRMLTRTLGNSSTPEEERTLWDLCAVIGRPVEDYTIEKTGKTYTMVAADACLVLVYDGEVIATPAVFEIEIAPESSRAFRRHRPLVLF